ncbi:UbiA family prenyltransferase [Rhodococcus ruber]|nr:UbiA family prenyltransferase [Rhodococcus ruber]
MIGILLSSPSLASIAVVIAWSTIFHYYICQLNNLADLDSDRNNPTRRPTPLTTGRVSPAHVRYWIFLELFVLMFIGILALNSIWAKVGLLALVWTVTYGNVYQKSSPRISPIVMDFLYGFAMGIPVLIIGAEFGDLEDGRYWILSLSVGLNFTILNMFAGNMKDLEWDLNSSCQTTAIALGVRPLSSTVGIQLTWGYRVLLSLTQLALSIVTVAAMQSELRVSSEINMILSFFAVLSTVGGLTDVLHKMRSGILLPPRGAQSGHTFRVYLIRPAHAFLNLASVCALVGALSPSPLFSVSILMTLLVGTFLLIAVGRRSAVEDNSPERRRI